MAEFANSTLFNSTAAAQAAQGQSASSFGFSLLGGIGAAAAQLLIFLLAKDRLPKIYQPKSFLVSERQRSNPIPPGIWQWILPVLRSSDDEFLQKAGLDAFFLCRYLLVLLKILGPVALVILPILLPINAEGGNNIEANVVGSGRNVTKGLDVLTMSNIQPHLYTRLWAHCILALVVIGWALYNMVMELWNFVRIRQAYLTSPQHRLRASASTVLVQALPKKFSNTEALAELFDVYPGGIRNIWVNRDYDKLADLIEERDDLAHDLEAGEADLIKACWKSYQKRIKAKDKTGKAQVDGSAPEDTLEDAGIDRAATIGDGFSANNPGQVHHTVDEAVVAIHREDTDGPGVEEKPNFLGRGIGAVAQGLGDFGRNIDRGFGHIVGRESQDRNPDGRPSESKHRFGAFASPFRRRDHASKTSNGIPEDDRQLELQERDTTNGTLVNGDERHSNEKSSFDKSEVLAYDPEYDEDKNTEPRWKKFIDEKDRPTMRVSLKWKWLPSWMNPRATKVDKIYYARKELARLNKLIEKEQLPESEDKYPVMKSAFIQFNNQAAAHMACQSVAHHAPGFMAPRLVEIAPNDVIWSNMSIPGWQRYVRGALVFTVCAGLVVLWTPLIAASSAISQLDALRKNPGFRWLQSWPDPIIALIQGLLPVILVAVLILLLGVLLRWIVRFQGGPTHMQVERTVQKYFFAFAFLQYFLVVSISSAFSVAFDTIRQAVTKGDLSFFVIPNILAQNIPQASNYFLSNILIQSLSQSAGGLLQPGNLFLFAWALIMNSLAREKFRTRTKLEQLKWGTKYPLYTTLACVAIIYSVIAPLILPLSIIGFAVWWFSTRYQMMYIYQYTIDTGGLLYPMAIKQLFAGIIVLELVMIGYFILVTTGASGDQRALDPKAIIPMTVVMAVALVLTVLFFFIIKSSFNPVLEFLPITLEDDAVRRDEEFAKLLAARHSPAEEQEAIKGTAQGKIDGKEIPNDDSDSTDRPAPDDEEAQHISRPGTTATEKDIDATGHERTGRAHKAAEALKKANPAHLLHTAAGRKNDWTERKRRSAAWNGGKSPSVSTSRQHSEHDSVHPLPSSRQQDPHEPMPMRELEQRLEEAQTSTEAGPVSTSPIVQPPTSSESTRPLNPNRLSDVPSALTAEPATAHDDELAGQTSTGDETNTSRRTRADNLATMLNKPVELLQKPLAAPLDFIAPNQSAVDAHAAALADEAKRLYGNIPDDLEDITPEARDVLLSRAFQHAALRAKRPCVWLPRDVLGVSDDELRNTVRFTSWIWVSNERQVLSDKGKCEYRGPPPDFDEVDLIQL